MAVSACRFEGTLPGMPDPVTYAQAAEILDFHVSNIPRLIATGRLTVHRPPGRVRGHLDRAEVEALVVARAEAAAARKVYKRRQRVDRRPDTDHDWLTPDQAARLIGITYQGVLKRIYRETLPAVLHMDRWWIRRDHLELVEHAHAAQRTHQP